MFEKPLTLAPVVNGWQINTDSMGVYGNYFLKRAIVALRGLGANVPEDAIYPLNIFDSKGEEPLRGERSYVMDFSKEELPPVNAFPGAEKEANWLPSPNVGKLGVTMRLYALKALAINGKWIPPAIKRVGNP